MLRIYGVLTVAILTTVPAWAGELDKEFISQPSKAVKAGVQKDRPAATQLSDVKAATAKASELDDESPTQAYRGGWGRGSGGWGRGWGGWGRGWGGWGRGWGGWGWPYYASAWRWGGGWPYYASLWRPYGGYGYYPYSYSGYYYPYDYCW